MPQNALPFGGLEILFILMIMMFALIGILLTVIPWWKICARVGLPPALSLLMLVPFANIVLPFYVAFTHWPLESGRRDFA